MITNSSEKLQKIKRLAELVRNRLEAEKEEKALKAYFIREVGVGALQAGDYVVIVGVGSRTDIDKEKLEEFLGTESLKNFQKTSHYNTVTVSVKGMA